MPLCDVVGWNSQLEGVPVPPPGGAGGPPRHQLNMFLQCGNKFDARVLTLIRAIIADQLYRITTPVIEKKRVKSGNEKRKKNGT